MRYGEPSLQLHTQNHTHFHSSCNISHPPKPTRPPQQPTPPPRQHTSTASRRTASSINTCSANAGRKRHPNSSTPSPTSQLLQYMTVTCNAAPLARTHTAMTSTQSNYSPKRRGDAMHLPHKLQTRPALRKV
ncbi:hypothetical protein M758_1G227100 [Ceratodon purpureus]|nr:hypothetical protein M758_1G227100 [Ceratodon purpureus]